MPCGEIKFDKHLLRLKDRKTLSQNRFPLTYRDMMIWHRKKFQKTIYLWLNDIENSYYWVSRNKKEMTGKLEKNNP